VARRFVLNDQGVWGNSLCDGGRFHFLIAFGEVS
jgi:hypothetical protein